MSDTPTTDDTKVEAKVIDLQAMVPEPRPEVWTLLGALESGVKAARKDLEQKNQPRALAHLTTVKAGVVSLEALLHQQVTDTLLQILTLALGNQIVGALKDGDVDKMLKAIEDKAKQPAAADVNPPSGYL